MGNGVLLIDPPMHIIYMVKYFLDFVNYAEITKFLSNIFLTAAYNRGP